MIDARIVILKKIQLLLSTVSIEEVTFSASGSSPGCPGDNFSLTCSVTFSNDPLPSDVPPPKFRWYFGPDGNASLPSGATPTTTALNSGRNTYTSILQFSPLRQSHAGMYTCQPGAKRLARSTNVAVNGIHT